MIFQSFPFSFTFLTVKIRDVEVEAVNFLWKRSGSTWMKEVGSGSELRNEIVEKKPEAEAIFLKSGASGFSTWLQPEPEAEAKNSKGEEAISEA